MPLDLNFLLLGSDDPPRLAGFYSRVLGVPSWDGGEWVGWWSGAAFLTVGPLFQPQDTPRAGSRPVVFGWQTDDVVGDCARMQSCGAAVVDAPFHPVDDPQGWLATLADPDGNYFQLLCPSEGWHPPGAATIPVVETDRLLLRAFREGDVDVFGAISADEETMRHVGGIGSREDTWRGIALCLGHWSMRGFGLWAVEEKATGRLIGRIGLHAPEGWPGVEVGWILSRDCWGRGYATEGARAAVRFAYETAGVEDLITIIDPRNDRSIRVAERLGATFRKQIDHRGSTRNLYTVPPAPAGVSA